MSVDIEHFTRLGNENLYDRRDNEAVADFKEALKCARKSLSPQAIFESKLNLGAALVACGRASEGEAVLKKAVAPTPQNQILNGNLWHNLSLAYDILDNMPQAVDNMQKAIQCYDQCSDAGAAKLKAGSACKLASMCIKLRNFSKAAAAFSLAAASYQADGNVAQQAVCLYHQARLLGLESKRTEAIAVADECARLCSEQPSSIAIGQLLNDLGLLYATCKEHDKALQCFENALPMQQWNTKDMKAEAVILQNMGAIHNCQEKYIDSIDFNRRAAEIYAQINCRSGQGQCFSNMAFAYSQIHDIDAAGEYYLHALQAARDTCDRNSEYQALEGLASVAYCQQKYDRCCEHLKNALIAVSADGSGSQTTAQQRLVDKLTYTMQLQLSLQHTQVSGQQDSPLESTDYTIQSNEKELQHTQNDETDGQHRELQDTMDDRQEVRKHMSEQLSRVEEQTNSSQDDSDDDSDDSDDDDGDSSNSSSESESSTHSQSSRVKSASGPIYTAPHPPRPVPTNDNTYLMSADDSQASTSGEGNVKQVKYSEPSQQDPNYMSIRIPNNAAQPTLPPRKTDQQSQKMTGGDTVQLPIGPKPKSKDSQACAIM